VNDHEYRNIHRRIECCPFLFGSSVAFSLKRTLSFSGQKATG